MGAERLTELLAASVRRHCSPAAPISVLFSGGLDSSFLTWLALREGATCSLVTVALPAGGDAQRATSAARRLGLEPTVSILAEGEVLLRATELRRTHPHLPLIDLSVQTALSLALDRTSEDTVLCGQGADELFVGYAHSRRLEGGDLRHQCEKDVDKLLQRDLPLSEEIARTRGRTLRSPYLDPDFMQEVMAIPWMERRGDGSGKPLLRSMARLAGLPSDIAERPKKAFQYGSGVHRLLQRRLSPSPPGP